MDSLLRVGGAGLNRQSTKPQPYALHADQERSTDGCSGRSAAREVYPAPTDRGAEAGAVVGVEGDRDVESVIAGDRDSEFVGAVGAVERRDVHGLGSRGAALSI